MYKHIALLALLLPFSGYAITKQERLQEILQEAAQIDSSMEYLAEMLKNNAWMIYVSGDSILQKSIEASQRIQELKKEYTQLELEIAQEKKCSKK